MDPGLHGGSTESRDDAGKWRKGVSGNPSGRPKYRMGVREALTGHLESTIARLVWLRDNGETHEVQLKAVKEILNRAVGTAPASVTEEDDGDRPDSNPGAVVAALINRSRNGSTRGPIGAPDLESDKPAAGGGNLQ